MKSSRVFALLASFTVAGCRENRTPDKFIFAEGFTGGAVVIYDMPLAPVLPVVDGANVLEIPADGALITSSPMDEGWAKDQFFQHRGANLIPLKQGAGSEEVFGGSTGSVGSCASVRMEYVGDPEKLAAMRDALQAKLLGSICKPKP